ncbi:hypothetical protein DFH07DRAFT_1066546 [Mycena maculata]|uniref:Uncharacterized protein n=1 Tax=Mycena maculata TaxID=230809 RepID=A0AAD7HSC9_9AGAR|nr:hypothetical protein DFH07DRAFT_1066546 [Mycena maculata]
MALPSPTERTPSLRSVSSTASLTRRSRTRTRSKTIGSSPRPDVTTFEPLISPQIYADQLLGEPSEIGQEIVGEPMVQVQVQDTHSVHSETGPKHSKAAAQALRLPGISTGQVKPLPSAFSRVPSIPQLYDLGNGHVRDSVHSQESGFTQSGGSSSLYPASTSTASGTESPPSPRSIAEQEGNNDVSSFDPELELQEYDGDDVSYRLRLLVKNNYFLPPAHSKPSSSDFAATVNSKKASRPPPTPTFFDMFRKSRSKPSTPTGAGQTFDFLTPALRTTSDSTTVSAYSPQQPRRRSSSQAPTHPRALQDPSGRVVVVREKMHDIATAAKQAEQEMKARGNRREESLGGHSEVEVIDPTDAVDLPPPSAAYPFAVQAAALHGMGVQDSVGAAVLADRLPPRSPGGSSGDDDWRKALLHAAVNHSLNNSSGVLASPTQAKHMSPASDKPMLGQRIISLPTVEHRVSSALSSQDYPDEPGDAPRSSTCLPLRVETPLMPITPLAPPPRRQLVNPLYSISQTSLPTNLEPTARSLSSAQVRKIESTPRLSDSYESDVQRHALISPPLISRESSEGSSRERPRTSSDSNASFYSEEEKDEALPRPSISSSNLDPRPSLSIYSRPSPTTSAFQDALMHPPVVNPPPRKSSLDQHRLPSAPSPVPRDSMASPPPRVSSSLAHIMPLSPPPRSSSLAQRIAPPSRLPPPIPTFPPAQSESEILDPGPSTPPFPLSDRRGGKSLVLEIPQTNHPSIRSAPAPSTPPSFFDSIQNQPNAMDDLDSSSDDDDESYQGDPEPPHTPLFVNPRTRAVSNMPSGSSSAKSLLMRLGNHSTPYVSRSADGHSPVVPKSHKPVGNIPVAGSFFSDRKSGKSDQGHGPPTSTFDFYQYAQQHPLLSQRPAESSTSRRPHTTDQVVRDWQTSQKAQESLRRLDGMLIQHMEAEKDTIKRIATNLQSNARP